ncbi:Elongation factor P-like protein, putative isoform 3 [Theobroma cacao]|uniref:Elongation factor P-like protein, putative isoform 3 n=1 Tax=Theobroma cacao TaxID=3641 RepID=A0A061GEX9_THECC|nr:Elongation factor P-like protein, putative isoform 3 [Theobroma cacao]
MAFAHSVTLLSPAFPTQFPSCFPRKLPFFPTLPFRNPTVPLLILSRSSPKPAPSTEPEALKFITDSDGITLPCVRTYENDLARLTLVGAVGFEQALTAAAADGGRAATEHVDSGIPAMVIETVFPSSIAKNATVSTRLFLPARKVKEKAQKLRKSLSEDILTETSSKNILAMTFRQVVIQKFWNFELVLFRPGTERDMEDLENPRKQVIGSFTLSSSEERVISNLGEVVCISALQSTERHFLDNFLGKTSSNFFQWFRKSKAIESKDLSVVIYKMFEDEIVENAKSLLESFNSSEESFKTMDLRRKDYWWTPSMHSKLDKIGGLEFSAWTSEFIPAYRLEINANTLKDLKFEGWIKSDENRWEVLLTHSQMICTMKMFTHCLTNSYAVVWLPITTACPRQRGAPLSREWYLPPLQVEFFSLPLVLSVNLVFLIYTKEENTLEDLGLHRHQLLSLQQFNLYTLKRWEYIA